MDRKPVEKKRTEKNSCYKTGSTTFAHSGNDRMFTHIRYLVTMPFRVTRQIFPDNKETFNNPTSKFLYGKHPLKTEIKASAAISLVVKYFVFGCIKSIQPVRKIVQILIDICLN